MEKEKTIVRKNLMTQKGYTPYCGNMNCTVMPRTFFNSKQFKCTRCTWVSQFPEDFITSYKEKWGLK